MHRYTYAYGYRTADAAEDAIENLCSEGEISTGENPKAESYRTQAGALRWRITLQG